MTSRTFVAAIVAAGILSWPSKVDAHSGDLLSAAAQVTPTIDGVLAPSEWDDADQIDFTLTGTGETHDTTLYVKNDDTYLYIAGIVRDEDVSDPTQPGFDFLHVYFDNDHDGLFEVGDDDWAIRGHDGLVVDAHTSVAANCPPLPVLSRLNDTGAGGTNDLVAAVTHSNPGSNTIGDYVVEFRGPLNSSDSLHDLNLGPGDTVGFSFHLADGEHMGPVTDFRWPGFCAPTFADIQILIPENAPPVCDDATASALALSPPNHELVPVEVGGVSDPDGDPVTVSILGVTQDEPVNGVGDGNTSPDAIVEGSGVLLRSERAGRGNGRVYAIPFEASDGMDSCSGIVAVCVPHHRRGAPCVDDGQDFDSTQP